MTGAGGGSSSSGDDDGNDTAPMCSGGSAVRTEGEKKTN